MQNVPSANLVEEAAEEIVRLRRENENLRQYRGHTERMLALFEGGPRPPGDMVATIDIVPELRTLAKALVVADSLSDQPGVADRPEDPKAP